MSVQKCVVFYSWQSDRPNNINRGFIEKALEVAAKNIRNDDSIAIDPVIDRDTSGVPGSPDIAHTIFAKIDQAQIFVCDVSIINSDTNGRPTPNPNVLIELGYAFKTLGTERVILVMNTAFGGPEKLPFDLRARRTVVYRSEGGEPDRSQERRILEGRLSEALRAVIQRLTVLELEGQGKALEIVRKLRQSRLDKIVANDMPIKVDGPAKLVLQVIPLSVIDSIKQYKVSMLGNDRNDIKFQLLMLETGCGVLSANFEGFVASRQLNRSTADADLYIQFFRDGSLEFVDTFWFREDENSHMFMSSVEHERHLIKLIPLILSVQERLGVNAPIAIFLSILGARGYYLNVDRKLLFGAMFNQPTNRFDRDRIECNEAVIDKFVIDADRVMRPAFDTIWNAAGWRESMNYDANGKWVGQGNN